MNTGRQVDLQTDTTYVEQEMLRFHTTARTRGMLYYRTVNLMALPAVALLSQPVIRDTVLFLLILCLAVGLNAVHLYLHFVSNRRMQRWLLEIVPDLIIYSALAALSGWFLSHFIYFFFMLILYSSSRFDRSASLWAGALSVVCVFFLYGMADIQMRSETARLAVVVLMIVCITVAAEEIGHLVNLARNQVADAFKGMLEANKSNLSYQAELLESEKHFRQLVERVDAIPWNLDLNTWRFTYVGQQAVRLLGYPLEDWYTENFWINHIYPDDREWAFRFCQETAFRREDHDFEYRMLATGGNIVWIRDSVNVVSGENGPRMLQGFMFDVTERKRSEEMLKARSLQEEAVAELGQRALTGIDLEVLMDEATAVVAQTLEVEYCKVLELLPDGRALLLRAGVGWKEGLVGHAIVGAGTDSQAGYTLLSSRPVIVEDLRTEKRFSGPALLHNHGVISGVSVIIGDQKQLFGVLGIHTTKQRIFTREAIHFLQAVANILAETVKHKGAEEELKRYYNHLEELVEKRTAELAAVNKELETFAYSVSHDLRAPLRGMHGFAQALLEDFSDTLSPTGKDFAGRIIDASERMDKMVQDLLSYSRITRSEIRLTSLSLEKVVKEAIRGTEEFINEKRAEVIVKTPMPKVIGHSTTMLQVITNLISNAIKFVQKDTLPKVLIWTEERGQRIRLWVEDNGIGIPEEHRKRIFEVFERLHC